MNDIGRAPEPDIGSPAGSGSKTGFRMCGYFAMHLIAVYLLAIAISPLLAGFFYRQVVPRLGGSIDTSGELQYYFSHLLVASLLPAFIAGYLNFKYRHTASLWVWLVPAIILVYEICTFQPSSLLVSKWSGAFAYFFSSDWSVPASAQEAFSGNLEGMRVYNAQTNFSAPFYAGVAYSLGALAGKLSE
jgi:hypothetical protein